MTCIVGSTLVEIRTDDGVRLRAANQLCVGDTINAVVPTRITYIFSQQIKATWTVVSYMGLDADPAQWVCLPSGSWERISRVGTPSLRLCESIHGFMVDGGKIIRAGGVDCCVHNYRDVPLPCMRSSSVSPPSGTVLSSPDAVVSSSEIVLSSPEAVLSSSSLSSSSSEDDDEM